MSANRLVGESANQRGQIERYFAEIVLPSDKAKKGENGRVLVIGGSRLFHAASFWSASMACRLVDMVHFSSPAMENNELMRVRAKDKFWEGIVVSWEEVGHYIEEDDSILIGPGMVRQPAEGGDDVDRTREIVNELLSKYPRKKWVVDGGALQMVDPELLTDRMIVTPNAREQAILARRVLAGVTVLAKGRLDVVRQGEEEVRVEGGGAGMVKGGTGDVLSGLVAGLYAKSPALAACVTASYVNKRAGERLAKRVGPYFSPQELLQAVPEVLWEVVGASGSRF